MSRSCRSTARSESRSGWPGACRSRRLIVKIIVAPRAMLGARMSGHRRQRRCGTDNPRHGIDQPAAAGARREAEAQRADRSSQLRCPGHDAPDIRPGEVECRPTRRGEGGTAFCRRTEPERPAEHAAQVEDGNAKRGDDQMTITEAMKQSTTPPNRNARGTARSTSAAAPGPENDIARVGEASPMESASASQMCSSRRSSLRPAGSPRLRRPSASSRVPRRPKHQRPGHSSAFAVLATGPWSRPVTIGGPWRGRQRGCSTMAVRQPSKLLTWVRFPSPAPITLFRVRLQQQPPFSSGPNILLHSGRISV